MCRSATCLHREPRRIISISWLVVDGDVTWIKLTARHLKPTHTSTLYPQLCLFRGHPGNPAVPARECSRKSSVKYSCAMKSSGIPPLILIQKCFLHIFDLTLDYRILTYVDKFKQNVACLFSCLKQVSEHVAGLMPSVSALRITKRFVCWFCVSSYF